jgi:hypothetical protein
MDLLLDNAEKVVSLLAGILAIGGFIFWRTRRGVAGEHGVPTSVGEASRDISGNGINNNATQSVTINLSHGDQVGASAPVGSHKLSEMPLIDLKRCARILFVDDDRGIKIVSVLKKMGWQYVKIVTDVSSLEDSAVLEADVVFVDINGVGRQMHYQDEGLGLALGIKRRHAGKKVIIYSAQEEGRMFHEALQEADYSLPKTAEPIRFEDAIVRVVRG